MLRFFGKMNAAHGRYWLYALAFPGAFALDMVTTLAIADWLIEVILVWIASVWGDPQEITLVTGIGSVTVIAGLWSSPADVPLWTGILNRLVAVAAMWTMLYVTTRRRADLRKGVPHTGLLPDLLPICASCKAIRTESGEWRALESYLLTNAGVRFTHGLCPACDAKCRETL
jgi:hypothetical protein